MQEMSRLTELRQPSRSNIGEGAPAWRKSLFQDPTNLRPSAWKFTDKQYLNILQSMAQSVHAFDLKMRIIFW